MSRFWVYTCHRYTYYSWYLPQHEPVAKARLLSDQQANHWKVRWPACDLNMQITNKRGKQNTGKVFNKFLQMLYTWTVNSLNCFRELPAIYKLK